MVKVEEVTDESFQENDDDYETSSDISSADSDNISIASSNADENETIYERIVALKDIVSPKTRLSFAVRYAATVGFVKKAGYWTGKAVWVLTTSALLVGLPLALAIEDEARITAQEKEQMMQQQGQAGMLPPPQGQQALVPPGF